MMKTATFLLVFGYVHKTYLENSIEFKDSHFVCRHNPSAHVTSSFSSPILLHQLLLPPLFLPLSKKKNPIKIQIRKLKKEKKKRKDFYYMGEIWPRIWLDLEHSMAELVVGFFKTCKFSGKMKGKEKERVRKWKLE